LIHWLLIFTESDWEVGLVSFVDEQPVSSTGMDRAAAATPARRTEVSEGIEKLHFESWGISTAFGVPHRVDEPSAPGGRRRDRSP
jgi:hypothetical protein